MADSAARLHELAGKLDRDGPTIDPSRIAKWANGIAKEAGELLAGEIQSGRILIEGEPLAAEVNGAINRENFVQLFHLLAQHWLPRFRDDVGGEAMTYPDVDHDHHATGRSLLWKQYSAPLRAIAGLWDTRAFPPPVIILDRIERMRNEWPRAADCAVYSPQKQIDNLWALVVKIRATDGQNCPTLPDASFAARLHWTDQQQADCWRAFTDALTLCESLTRKCLRAAYGRDTCPGCGKLGRVDDGGAVQCTDCQLRSSKPLAVVPRNIAQQANRADWLLDRYPETPEGRVRFMEFVRDEVQQAVEAKRNQSANRDSNDTIKSMVGGIKWQAAGERIETITELPTEAVERLAAVLRWPLTDGTIAQVEPLLTEAVKGLRAAYQNARQQSGKLDVREGEPAGAEGKQATDKERGPSPAEANLTTTADHSIRRLLSVYSGGIADDRFNQAVLIIGNGQFSSNEKLVGIEEHMPLPPTASARTLGELLGVSAAAIKKTEWWKSNRAGRAEELQTRRESVHRERSGRYEADFKD